jgi:putative oxidoreductase
LIVQEEKVSDRPQHRAAPSLRGSGSPFTTYGLGILQLLGGAALALGFLTRPTALVFAIEMIVSVILHYPHGYTFAAPGGGYEFPLIMLLVFVAIFFRGAGRCSLDRMIGKEF